MSESINKDDFHLKCVTLKGDLPDMGKHILMPFGFTLCGLPTVAAKVEDFPDLKNPIVSDMISEYTEEEWEITCEKCIEVFEIVKKIKSPNAHQ